LHRLLIFNDLALDHQRRRRVDVPTILICAVTLGIIITMKRVPEPALIAASGVVGLLLQHAL